MFADGPAGDLYARAFAPAAGMDEDPATGPACAALAASLAHASKCTHGHATLTMTQGVAMGRLSSIVSTAVSRGDGLVRVTVGGLSTVVGRGVLPVP